MTPCSCLGRRAGLPLCSTQASVRRRSSATARRARASSFSIVSAITSGALAYVYEEASDPAAVRRDHPASMEDSDDTPMHAAVVTSFDEPPHFREVEDPVAQD